MHGAGIATRMRIQAGHCGTHGLVQATRRLPPPYLPLSIYTIHRALAEDWPGRCPQCGAKLTPVSAEEARTCSNQEEDE